MSVNDLVHSTKSLPSNVEIILIICSVLFPAIVNALRLILVQLVYIPYNIVLCKHVLECYVSTFTVISRVLPTFFAAVFTLSESS